MSLYTICPTCSTGYDLHDIQRGKRVVCKACKAAFVAEDASEIPVAAVVESETYRVEDEPPLALPVAAARRSFKWDDMPPRRRPRREPAGMSPAVLVPLIVVPIVVLFAAVLLICMVSEPTPFDNPPRRVIVVPGPGVQNQPVFVRPQPAPFNPPAPPRFNPPAAPPRFNPGRPAPGRIR